MSAAEFQAAHDVAVAERVYRDQYDDLTRALAEANGAAAAALSHAQLVFGPMDCGPAVNLQRQDFERDLAEAIRALRRAREKAEGLEQARAAARARP